MRSILTGSVLSLLGAAVPFPLTAQEPAPPAAPKAAATVEAPRPAAAYLVVFSLGPAWDRAKPPAEQSGFREHGRNLKRLRDEGRITLGARYSDKGMIVLRAESETAARGEIASDPGVRAGLFTFEVNALQPFYAGCLETPGPAKAASERPPS